MKKQLSFLTILLLPFFIEAQNVGIGTTTPSNKLTVNGNLVVMQPASGTDTAPTAAQTQTMVNGSTLNYTSTDSTGRFYDPGGPSGNYLPNLSAYTFINGLSNNNTGIQITIENMDLGTGDSLIISDGGGTVLMQMGNGYTTTGTYTFFSISHSLFFQFKSNADASVGAGFSILWKYLFGVPQPAITNYTSNAFLFDVNKGAIRSGAISNDLPGNYSTAMGEAARATGEASTAFGRGWASGSYATALGLNTYASGNNATSVGFATAASGESSLSTGNHTNASGDYSTAMGNYSTASGDSAVAIGSSVNASGLLSTAIGYSTTAAGTYSTAMGYITKANGNYATSIGNRTNARSYASLAFGNLNDSIAGSSATSWVNTDPLLYIGNAVNPFLRHNAAVIYKNGDADLNGYVRLGESTDGSPRIKVKKLTINTPGTQGSFNFIAHGLTQSKILSITGLATVGIYQIVPNHEQAGFKYTINVESSNIAVGTVAGNSGSVLNVPVVILVTYEE